MTNNDILRRLRYVFDFNDAKMISLFAQAGVEVKRSDVSSWLKKDDDEDYKALKDVQFAAFLNGFINEKRGKREGAEPKAETRLTNNIIFQKLKIALELKAEDVLEVLALSDFEMSKNELSAFFRKAGHKNYRECKDQVLRNFLRGLQTQHRGEGADLPEYEW